VSEKVLDYHTLRGIMLFKAIRMIVSNISVMLNVLLVENL